MKCDEYGFTLIKFYLRIPYSTDLFAFLLQIQQIFFVDEVYNVEWSGIHIRGEAKIVEP
jgi:hypothetical protein